MEVTYDALKKQLTQARAEITCLRATLATARRDGRGEEMSDDLVATLHQVGHDYTDKAADLIKAQAARIAELEATLERLMGPPPDKIKFRTGMIAAGVSEKQQIKYSAAPHSTEPKL